MLVCVLLCWVGYQVFAAGFPHAARLPHSAYRSGTILAEFFTARHYPAFGIFLLLCIRSARFGWEQFEHGRVLRTYALVLCCLLAYSFALYPFNYFLDQWHLLDRLVLVGLAISVYRWPLMVVPVLFYANVMHWQVNGPYPIGTNMTDKRLAFDVVAVLAAYIVLRAVLTKDKTPLAAFVFFTLIVIGADYFWPGYLKTVKGPERWSWVTDNNITHLALMALGQGFTPLGLPRDIVLAVLGVLAKLQLLLGSFVILGELAGLVCLASRKFAVVVLANFILLNAGIFFLSGIFFWKWMVADAAFLWLLLRLPAGTLGQVFLFAPGRRPGKTNVALFGLSVVAIALSSHLLFPVGLAWFDSKATHSFHLFATGVSGTRYEIPRGFFAPYDLYFSQNRLYYLEPEDKRTIIGTYGGGSYSRSVRINRTKSVEDYLDLLQTEGRSSRNEKAIAGLSGFLETWFAHYNERGPRPRTWLSRLVTRPNHIHTTVMYAPRFKGQERVTRVEIERMNLYYDGRDVVVAERDLLLVLELDEPADQPEDGDPGP